MATIEQHLHPEENLGVLIRRRLLTPKTGQRLLSERPPEIRVKSKVWREPRRQHKTEKARPEKFASGNTPDGSGRDLMRLCEIVDAAAHRARCCGLVDSPDVPSSTRWVMSRVRANQQNVTCVDGRYLLGRN